MHRSLLAPSSLAILLASCGTSAAPGAAPGAAPVPTTTGPALQAVPLAAARWYEGAAEVLTRNPADRTAACWELHVFEEGHHDPCQPGAIDGGTATGLPAPWTSADVLRVETGAAGSGDSAACALVLGVAGAAYVVREWLPWCDDGDRTTASAAWTVGDAVAGGSPELSLKLTVNSHEIEDGERVPLPPKVYQAWCGIGASGTPACTAPVEAAQAAGARPAFP